MRWTTEQLRGCHVTQAGFPPLCFFFLLPTYPPAYSTLRPAPWTNSFPPPAARWKISYAANDPPRFGSPRRRRRKQRAGLCKGDQAGYTCVRRVGVRRNVHPKTATKRSRAETLLSNVLDVRCFSLCIIMVELDITESLTQCLPRLQSLIGRLASSNKKTINILHNVNGIIKPSR